VRVVVPATVSPAPGGCKDHRLVRLQPGHRDAGIPYEVPSRRGPPERVDSVLRVIYLVFNEGCAACSGDSWKDGSLSRRSDFSREQV